MGRQAGNCVLNTVEGNCTYIAQALRNDQIRLQLLEQRNIKLIKGAARAEGRTHRPVNFLTRNSGRNMRASNLGNLRRFGWVIALMRHAHK